MYNHFKCKQIVILQSDLPVARDDLKWSNGRPVTSAYKPLRNHEELYIYMFVSIHCCMHLKLSYCLCNVHLFSSFIRIISTMQFEDEKILNSWSRRPLETDKSFWWWLNRYRGEISVSNILSIVCRQCRILKELVKFVRKKVKTCYHILEGNFWSEKLHKIKLWALDHPMWIHNLSFYKVVNHHDINRSQKT